MSISEELLKKSNERISNLLKNIKESKKFIYDEIKRIEKGLKKRELTEDQAIIARKALNGHIKSYARLLMNFMEEAVNQVTLLETLKGEQPEIKSETNSLEKDLNNMRIEALTLSQLSHLREFTDKAEKIVKLFREI